MNLGPFQPCPRCGVVYGNAHDCEWDAVAGVHRIRITSKHLTVTEAAASLGINRSTLLHQIKNGAIKATKVGPIWVLTEKEVERYRATSKGKRGRRA